MRERERALLHTTLQLIECLCNRSHITLQFSILFHIFLWVCFGTLAILASLPLFYCLPLFFIRITISNQVHSRCFDLKFLDLANAKVNARVSHTYTHPMHCIERERVWWRNPHAFWQMCCWHFVYDYNNDRIITTNSRE